MCANVIRRNIDHHRLTRCDRNIDPETRDCEAVGAADTRHLQLHFLAFFHHDHIRTELPVFRGDLDDTRVFFDCLWLLLWRYCALLTRRTAGGKSDCDSEREKECKILHHHILCPTTEQIKFFW